MAINSETGFWSFHYEVMTVRLEPFLTNLFCGFTIPVTALKTKIKSSYLVDFLAQAGWQMMFFVDNIEHQRLDRMVIIPLYCTDTVPLQRRYRDGI